MEQNRRNRAIHIENLIHDRGDIEGMKWDDLYPCEKILQTLTVTAKKSFPNGLKT